MEGKFIDLLTNKKINLIFVCCNLNCMSAAIQLANANLTAGHFKIHFLGFALLI